MNRQRYHHGNLKQALVDAALELVEKSGPQSFTLAEAAKRAGVSAAAPYRHFRSKDELFEEAARQGFEMFADLMEFAYDQGQPSALSAFSATGRAYLAFAKKYPGHYIIMFESGVSLVANPALAHASNRARDVLHQAANQLAEHIPADRRPPASMITNHVWALSHGVVELFDRHSAGTKSQFTADDLLETGVGIYLRGLGLIERDN